MVAGGMNGAGVAVGAGASEHQGAASSTLQAGRQAGSNAPLRSALLLHKLWRCWQEEKAGCVWMRPPGPGPARHAQPHCRGASSREPPPPPGTRRRPDRHLQVLQIASFSSSLVHPCVSPGRGTAGGAERTTLRAPGPGHEPTHPPTWQGAAGEGSRRRGKTFADTPRFRGAPRLCRRAGGRAPSPRVQAWVQVMGGGPGGREATVPPRCKPGSRA